MQLDDILEAYPKTIKLKDGSTITVRPLKMADEKAFHTFFVAVPDNERILFKHRVTDPVVIHEWCHRIDYGKILPLLALDGDKIAADASLHQTLGGWKRHIGRISVVTHPKYRGKGIAGILAYAATKPDTFRVQRAASIKAPPEKIFPLLNDLHNFASWSPYERKDPAMKRTHSGAPSGKGAVYAWDGDKNVGSGRLAIASLPRHPRSRSTWTCSGRWQLTTSSSSRWNRRASPPTSRGP